MNSIANYTKIIAKLQRNLLKPLETLLSVRFETYTPDLRDIFQKRILLIERLARNHFCVLIL
mgnify:CR=1 FL=1